jgi:hypothetical protein
MKLRRPECSHRGTRPSKKRARRDLRFVLAGAYDVSDDEDVDEDAVMESAEESGSDEDEDEVCTHSFPIPDGACSASILLTSSMCVPTYVCPIRTYMHA